MRTAFLVVLAALLLLPVAFAASNTTVTTTPAPAKERGAATNSHASLFFETPSQASLEFDETWDVAHAPAARQSLDAYFGNGDGKLSSAEVQAIMTASADDMTGASSGIFSIDGGNLTVTIANATIDGADDPAAPLVIHVHQTLAFPTLDPTQPHTLRVTPLATGDVMIQAPPGFVLPATDRVPLRAGTPVDVKIAPPAPPTPSVTATPTPAASPTPSPMPTVSESTAAKPATPPKSFVPAPALVLVTITIVGSALLLQRLRRRV